MSLLLKHSKVYCGIRSERKQLENGLIKEELIIRENTEMNIPLTLNSFTVQGHESWESVGLKLEIGGKKYFKRIYSETVRCRSRSALKTLHLWSETACFNPHCLSENSKWRSKPFHHCGTKHMLPFLQDFLPFVMGLHINQIVKL